MKIWTKISGKHSKLKVDLNTKDKVGTFPRAQTSPSQAGTRISG
jgi:hypothetical protein